VALETFNYLNSLVASNPVVADGLVNGDDHIRGIKSTLLATFPNLTGAVTASQTDLNNLQGWLTTGARILNSSVRFGSGTSLDYFFHAAAGEVDLYLNDALAMTLIRSGSANTFTWRGQGSFTGGLTGPGATPLGATVLWWSDLLPDANWAWCNGQAVSRTTYAGLFAIFGTTYGAGNGSSTFNLPNLCEVAPIGRSQMGGAASPGFLSSISDSLKAVLNQVFGTQSVTLDTSQIPTHIHNNTVSETPHSHSGGVVSTGSYTSPGGATAVVQNVGVGNTGTATAGVSIANAAAGGGASHTNVQPCRAVNWIIRVL
jgi:microcystin-dependent protein